MEEAGDSNSGGQKGGEIEEEEGGGTGGFLALRERDADVEAEMEGL